MTARSVCEAVTAIGGTANITKLAADQASEAVFNSTRDLALAAYNAGGSFATFDGAIRAAHKTLAASKLLNSHNHQVAVQAAKDQLRSSLDFAPA
jgi:hypothetical protein